MNLLNRNIKPILNNIQRLFMLNKMKDMQKSYKERGSYCYEIYTIMSAIALKENIPYGLEVHLEIMDAN